MVCTFEILKMLDVNWCTVIILMNAVLNVVSDDEGLRETSKRKTLVLVGLFFFR